MSDKKVENAVRWVSEEHHYTADELLELLDRGPFSGDDRYTMMAALCWHLTHEPDERVIAKTMAQMPEAARRGVIKRMAMAKGVPPGVKREVAAALLKRAV